MRFKYFLFALLIPLWGYAATDALPGVGGNITSTTTTSSSTTSSTTTTSSNSLTTGLVAYYCFDELSNLGRDCSGNNNTGTPSGGVSATTGVSGGAANFGGTGNPGSIHIPNSNSLMFDHYFTAAYFIKLNSGEGMNGMGDSSGGWHTAFAKSHDRSGFYSRLDTNGNTKQVNVLLVNNVYASPTLGISVVKDSSSVIQNWVHVAFVLSKDGNLSQLYFNGELVKEETDETMDLSIANTQDLYLGKYSDFWYPLNGMLDDVRFYNRVLSASEVKQLANIGTVAPAVIPVITKHELTGTDPLGNPTNIVLTFKESAFYDLERSTDQVNYSRVYCSANQAGIATTDTQIKLGITYWYRVRMSTQPVSCSSATNWSAFSLPYQVTVPAELVKVLAFYGDTGNITGSVGTQTINCGAGNNNCQINASVNSSVSLTATAASSGYKFSAWSGCPSPNGNTCQFTLAQRVEVGASFVADSTTTGTGTTTTTTPTPVTCTSTLENLGTAKTQNAAVTVEMPNINLCGGIQVNSGARQNKVVQKLSDDVDVSAKLTVNMDSYVGQAADLVVYAAYTPLNSTASLNFMLNESGVPIVWENTLVAFKSNVTLSKTQDISMYKGKFVGTGRLQVYFGFRLKKDGIVIVNSTPIDIMINP